MTPLFGQADGVVACRLMEAHIEGDIGYTNGHTLIWENGKVSLMVDDHRFGLFEKQDYITGFESAGFDVSFDPSGLIGRGLYVAKKK
jgi:hypothetical protein